MTNIELEKLFGSEDRPLKVAVYAIIDTWQSDITHEFIIGLSKNRISQNPAWQFAGAYIDLIVDGYAFERPERNRMVEDAKAGKLQLILSSSINRFARLLPERAAIIDELFKCGVGVIFDDVCINTMFFWDYAGREAYSNDDKRELKDKAFYMNTPPEDKHELAVALVKMHLYRGPLIARDIYEKLGRYNIDKAMIYSVRKELDIQTYKCYGMLWWALPGWHIKERVIQEAENSESDEAEDQEL